MSHKRISELMDRVAGLERIIHNLFKIGTIKSVNAVAYTCVVEIGDLFTAPLNWLVPRAGKDKEWFTPDVGEQVMVFSPSGDLNQGLVLPGVFSDQNPPNSSDENIHRVDYEDGSYIEHSKSTGKMTLSSVGELNLLAVGNINITSQAEVHIND